MTAPVGKNFSTTGSGKSTSTNSRVRETLSVRKLYTDMMEKYEREAGKTPNPKVYAFHLLLAHMAGHPMPRTIPVHLRLSVLDHGRQQLMNICGLTGDGVSRLIALQKDHHRRPEVRRALEGVLVGTT
jgi:hypothetical protein